MHIHYPSAISETEPTLRSLERQLRGSRLSDRVRLLRLLKTGQFSTLHACAPALNFSLIQLKRWWRLYRLGGLSALLTVQRPGRKRRVSSTAQRDVQRAFLSGQLRTLAEARAYLHTQHGVSYQSLSSVWLLLPQHRPYLRRNQQPRSGEEVASSDPGNTLTPVNGAPEPTSQWKAT